MIQVSGIICTGAGMFSPQPLQQIAKSQRLVWGRLNTKPIVGEQKAKCHP